MCIILLKLHTAICTGFAHLLNSNSCHILKRHVFRKKITSFEVLTMVLSKNKVFWYAMPCQLASSHRYFKGSQCLHLQSQAVQSKDKTTLILWNVSNHLPADMVQHLRGLESSTIVYISNILRMTGQGGVLNILASFNSVIYLFCYSPHQPCEAHSWSGQCGAWGWL